MTIIDTIQKEEFIEKLKQDKDSVLVCRNPKQVKKQLKEVGIKHTTCIDIDELLEDVLQRYTNIYIYNISDFLEDLFSDSIKGITLKEVL